jgi:hypothetical protein
MPRTYEPIASVLSSATSTTLSNIPSTYTDLVVTITHTTTQAAADIFFRFNGDSGSNYSRTFMFGFNNAATSGRQSSQTSIGTAGDNTLHMNVIQIMSYANTNVFKTVLDSFGGASRIVGRQVALWRSTAAITSIEVITSAVSGEGTRIHLYGIKAA